MYIRIYIYIYIYVCIYIHTHNENQTLAHFARYIEDVRIKAGNMEVAAQFLSCRQIRGQKVALKAWLETVWDLQRIQKAVAAAHADVRQQQVND